MHTSMNERASPQQSTSPTNSYESACRLSTGRLSQQHRERTHAQAPTAASAVLHTLMPCQRQNVTAPRPIAQSYAERPTQDAHPALKQEPPYATARRFSSPGQQDTAHVPLLARAGSVQSPGSQPANPRGGHNSPLLPSLSGAAPDPSRHASSQRHPWCEAAPLSPLQRSWAAHALSTAGATIGASPSPRARPHASRTPQPLRQQRIATGERYAYARAGWPRSGRLLCARLPLTLSSVLPRW